MISDLPTALWWYFGIFAVGIIFLPLTSRIFKNFFDRGYALSKILGILLTSYTVWLLGSLRVLPFTEMSVYLVIIAWVIINYFSLTRTVLLKKGLSFKAIRNLKIFILEEFLFLTAFLFWVWVRGHEPSVHGLEKFMDFGFMNSILQTKFFPPQDMWLAPANPEVAEGLASNVKQYSGGFFINYYYYGHYVTAFLMKLTRVLPEISYNLMLSTIFGLCFSASFSIGYNLYLFSRSLGLKIKEKAEEYKQVVFNYQAIITGLLSAALVTIAGNLHTIYLFTSGYPNENPVPFWQILKFTINQTYWYPNATRFVPNTIHEFPSYSWVVADLHGHVLDIPFVLLTIALLLSFISRLNKNHSKNETNSKFEIRIFEYSILPLLGLTTAVMYMTNAWDGIIYLALSGLVIVARQIFFTPQINRFQPISNSKFLIPKQNPNTKSQLKKIWSLDIENLLGIRLIRSIRNSWKNILIQTAILFVSFMLFSFPFNSSFKPFVHGIGVVGGWEIANSLGLIKDAVTPESIDNNKVVHFGPFLLEKGNSFRSPLWMLAVLWGFFYFHVIIFISNLIRTVPLRLKGQSFKNQKSLISLNPSDLFALLLIIVSTGLLIFPEFFYMKDIYPGHYRANTMFKLGYQAFIMLSIVSAYVIMTRIRNIQQEGFNLKRIGVFILKTFSLFILIMVLIYPYYGIQSYYGAFGNRKYEGQNGMKWLKNSYPDDYETVLWFRKNIPANTPKQPVILEAVGDSYTDYARISANTGIPTVLGWPVHEWLWRGSYDEPGKRVEEVKKMYETPQMVKNLFEKYKVKYVVIGSLERQKYSNINEDYFENNAEVVFSSNYTKVYKLN